MMSYCDNTILSPLPSHQTGVIQHVRVCMTGDANLDLQLYIYREVEVPRTGEVGGGIP